MNKITPKSRACLFGFLLLNLNVFPAQAEEPIPYASPELAVSDSVLSQESGQGLNPSNANLANNSISVTGGSSLVNGNNIIGDQALSDVNGITTVIQNSGNNVIVQTATQINVEFQK